MGKAELLARLRSEISALESESEGHKEAVPSRRPKSGPLPNGSLVYEAGGSASPIVDAAGREGAGCKQACSAGFDPADAQAAFRKIVDLLKASDKSERAIRDRLARCGFGEEAIDAAVLRARECSFVDDGRFAEVLIRSRIAQGKGSAGIERELKQHDIDPASIAGWPFDFDVDYEAELERALGLLKRKPPRSKNLRESAFRKLVNRGFPTSVASSAARIFSES